MKPLNDECQAFLESLGCSENQWGEPQINSMSAAFYAGALTSFVQMSEISGIAETEDDGAERLEEFRIAIMKNIKEQTDLMQKIWENQNGG